MQRVYIGGFGNCHKVDKTLFTSDVPYSEEEILELKRRNFGLIFSIYPMPEKLVKFAEANGVIVKSIPDSLRGYGFYDAPAVKSFFRQILLQETVGKKVILHCSTGTHAAPFISNLYSIGRGLGTDLNMAEAYNFHLLLRDINLPALFKEVQRRVNAKTNRNRAHFKEIMLRQKFAPKTCRTKIRLVTNAKKQKLIFSPGRGIGVKKLRRNN